MTKRWWLAAALLAAGFSAAQAASSGLKDREVLHPPPAVWQAYKHYSDLRYQFNQTKAPGEDAPQVKEARRKLMLELEKFLTASKKKSFQKLADDPKAPAWIKYETSYIRRFLEDAGLVRLDAKDYSYCAKERPPCPIECYQGPSSCGGGYCTSDVSCQAPRYNPSQGR